MPQIPVYNSQRNINAQQAQPIRDEASQIGKGADLLVKTTTEIAQKWSEAQDVMQYTQAKADYEIATSSILARAEADPDYKNSAKYFKELEDVKKKSTELITNRQVQDKFSLEADYGNRIAQIKINANFAGKQIAVNKVNVKNAVDTLTQKKLSLSNPNEIAQAQAEIENLLKANVLSGTLSYEEADKLLKEAEKTAVQYEIYNDNSTEEKQSAILKELKNNKGKFSTLDPDTRLKLIKESQDRVFQNNQTMQRATKEESEERTNNLITDLANQKVDFKRIDDEFAVPEDQGGVSRATLRSFKEIVTKGTVDSLNRIKKGSKEAKSYFDAFDTILNTDDRAKAKELIVKAWEDEKLSLEEGAYLDSILSETKKKNDFSAGIRKVWRQIQGYKDSNEKEAAMSLNELIKRARNGIDPNLAADQIITEDAIKRNPRLSEVTEEGAIFMDAFGVKQQLKMIDGILKFFGYEEKKDNK